MFLTVSALRISSAFSTVPALRGTRTEHVIWTAAAACSSNVSSIVAMLTGEINGNSDGEMEFDDLCEIAEIKRPAVSATDFSKLARKAPVKDCFVYGSWTPILTTTGASARLLNSRQRSS